MGIVVIKNATKNTISFKGFINQFLQNVFHSSLGDLLVVILGKYFIESDALTVLMFHIVTTLYTSYTLSRWLWLCSSIYFMDSCIHHAMIMQTSPKKLYACSCVDIQSREEIGLTNNIKKDAKIITRCVHIWNHCLQK